MNFGEQNIGNKSSPQSVMLTNTEKTPVSIASITITGTNAGNFAQANNCPSSLSASGSCSFSVTFTPTASAGFAASLSISDSLPGSPQTVALSGTGVIPAPSLSPANIAFPSQYVGTSGLPQTITLTNNSGNSLNISTVTTSVADFGLLNACGSTLNAGSNCSIGVIFDPKQGGSRSGVLTVNTSTGSLTANLTGAGEDFSLASSSPNATVMAGQSATYTVNISPIGGFNQAVNLTCSGAPAQSTCSLSSNSVTLNGSTPTKVTVTVTTAGGSAVLAPPNFFPDDRGGALVCMGLFGLLVMLLLYGPTGCRFKSRVRVLYVLGFLCVASLGLLLTGCGGSSGGGTSANTYNLSVTGTFASSSTTLTNSAKLTLVVQ